MKKLIALFCVVLCICMLVACGNNNDTPIDESTNPSQSEEVKPKDPQKEHAITPETLTQYAKATGDLTNYCLALTYTTDSKSTVTIFMNDGQDKQREHTITNTIINGAHILDKNTITKWSTKEKLIYDETNPDNITTTEYANPVEPKLITVEYTLNRIIADEFYNALLNAFQTAEYDILNERYILGTISMPHGDETIIFETVYCTILNGYIESVTCMNSTQTLTFEINTIHTTQIP